MDELPIIERKYYESAKNVRKRCLLEGSSFIAKAENLFK